MIARLNQGAGRAAGPSVGHDPLSLGLDVPFAKTLGKIGLSTKVGLIGRSPAKYHRGDPSVVVQEVCGDQFLETGERIELMQVQPSMPELIPQSLDQGIRLGDVDLGDHVLGDFAQFVVGVDGHVLGPAIGEDLDLLAYGAGQSFYQNLSSTLGGQRGLQRPGKHTSQKPSITPCR